MLPPKLIRFCSSMPWRDDTKYCISILGDILVYLQGEGYEADSLAIIQSREEHAYGFIRFNIELYDEMNCCKTLDQFNEFHRDLKKYVHWEPTQYSIVSYLYITYDWKVVKPKTLQNSFLNMVRDYFNINPHKRKDESKMDDKITTLADTAKLMESLNFRDRFKAEYLQLKIRAKLLSKTLEKLQNGELSFTPKCPYDLLHQHLVHMQDYLSDLEKRANIEGISLLWLNDGAPKDAS